LTVFQRSGEKVMVDPYPKPNGSGKKLNYKSA